MHRARDSWLFPSGSGDPHVPHAATPAPAPPAGPPRGGEPEPDPPPEPSERDHTPGAHVSGGVS
jgi:hypothetical protein